MMPELEAAHQFVKDIVPQLHAARTAFAKTKSDADRRRLDDVQREASERHVTFQKTLRRIEEASGIPQEVLDAAAEPKVEVDSVDRTRRQQLTAEAIAPTADIDEKLPFALEGMLARLPAGWLGEESADQFQLSPVDTGEPVSIVKGVRPESEAPNGHRLRQMIYLAQDYQAGDARYDHFGGAMLIPQLAALGNQLRVIHTIANSEDRVLNLRRKRFEVDATCYELLVGAALARKGRSPAFIPETQHKTPDIRCTDPFPLVVECKRRQSLSDYERGEEAAMRNVFSRLEHEARRKGLFGVFELRLCVEASELDVEDIIQRCLLQRLVAHPERPLTYPWGSVAYREGLARVEMPGATKAYSPDMLDYAFDWNSDLPEWDGLICKAETAEGLLLDTVRGPIAMAWSNTTPSVVTKRSRPPTSLFNSASQQIPGGEFGIVYLAYNEGARKEIADERVAQIGQRLHEWEHEATFLIPATFVTRLYPRALDGGQPDLIESCVNYYSEPAGGGSWFFEAYPSRIFTPG